MHTTFYLGERKVLKGKKVLKSHIWAKRIQLVKQIDIVANDGNLSIFFGLKYQLKDASVSNSANIAEWFKRYSRKYFLTFINIAKWSDGELRSLLRVNFEVGYIEPQIYYQLYN
ncbi:MAG: four helix bundle protein [Cyanobacteria bacterium QS_7_48_42]|nr:MAG: four helix bundle protein [Cyanobacteria bacterium QS_7_48_42]